MQSLAEMLNQQVTPFYAWAHLHGQELQQNSNIVKAEASIKLIRECMDNVPKTIPQICKKTGLSHATVSKYIEQLGVSRGNSTPIKWVRKCA